MKISYNWLQTYFEEPLPEVKKLAEALTFHAFEVEGVEEKNGDAVLEVDVLPNRAHNCLSHLGVAMEVATILNLKLKQATEAKQYPASKEFKVTIQDPKLCRRYTGAIIKGVKVGPSPEWLKTRLEAIGQRSINNVVDAANFVMFDMGQPLHAFDLKKLAASGGVYEITVKKLTSDECLIALDEKSYDLKEGTLVIADGNSDQTLAIAGVKGGASAAVKDSTVDLVLESANFEPVAVRKTGRSLGLITDAQKRFENELTPEVAFAGLTDFIELILKVAGGTVEGIVDVYPKKVVPYKVGTSLKEVNALLGTSLKAQEVEGIITRLGFVHECVTPSQRVPELAKSLLGKPYVWGASVLNDAPEKFDCSSFTSYLFKESGVQIPRVVIDQYVWGREITEKELQPGDIIFSKTERKDNPSHSETIDFMKGTPVSNGVSHLGIFMGEGKIIHASESRGVIEEDLATAESFKEIVGYRRMVEIGEKRWCVIVPAVRIDIRIKEDLIEEIGRIYGYRNIRAKTPEQKSQATLNKQLYYTNKIKQSLLQLGFSEVYTYSFTDSGEVAVANPLASDKGFLRTSLTPGLTKSLDFNLKNADFLGLDQIKIFEIGKVFKGGKEYNSLCVGVANVKGFKNKNLEKDEQTINGEIRWTREELWKMIAANVQTLCTIDDSGGLMVIKGKQIGVINNADGIMELDFAALIAALPEPTEVFSMKPSKNEKNEVVRYQPISVYPFIVRDIAVFVPGEQTEENQNKVLDIIKKEGTELMVTYRLFDVFTKKKEDEETKTSYGYRMVFQANDRTLTDDEVGGIMTKITDTMNADSGWQVR